MYIYIYICIYIYIYIYIYVFSAFWVVWPPLHVSRCSSLNLEGHPDREEPQDVPGLEEPLPPVVCVGVAADLVERRAEVLGKLNLSRDVIVVSHSSHQVNVLKRARIKTNNRLIGKPPHVITRRDSFRSPRSVSHTPVAW